MERLKTLAALSCIIQCTLSIYWHSFTSKFRRHFLHTSTRNKTRPTRRKKKQDNSQYRMEKIEKWEFFEWEICSERCADVLTVEAQASWLTDSLSLSLYLVRFRFRSTAQRNRRYWFNSKRKMEHDIRCVWGLVHQQHQRHRRTQCAKAIYQTLQLFSTLPFTTGTRTDSIIRHHTRRIVLLDLKHFFCVCVWCLWWHCNHHQHPTPNTNTQHHQQ